MKIVADNTVPYLKGILEPVAEVAYINASEFTPECVKDADAPAEVIALAIKTVKDDERLAALGANIKKLGLPDSADIIANEVIKLARK